MGYAQPTRSYSLPSTSTTFSSAQGNQHTIQSVKKRRHIGLKKKKASFLPSYYVGSFLFFSSHILAHCPSRILPSAPIPLSLSLFYDLIRSIVASTSPKERMGGEVSASSWKRVAREQGKLYDVHDHLYPSCPRGLTVRVLDHLDSFLDPGLVLASSREC